jgi:hypothetical protein
MSVLFMTDNDEYRPGMKQICICDDAVCKINGYTPVSADVLEAVFNSEHWTYNKQVITIIKPLVDLIGNLESQDATLADCMLELLKNARHMERLKTEEGHNPALTAHAKTVFVKDFHNINTDLHCLALFLHPAGCRVAIGKGPGLRTLNELISVALGVAKKWG